MPTVKLQKIGNSLGLILPKEVVDLSQVAEGDALHLIPDGDGARLTAFDPTFDDAIAAFEQTRKRYRNALSKLAT